MNVRTSLLSRLTVLTLAAAMTSGAALADKGGKHGHKNEDNQGDRGGYQKYENDQGDRGRSYYDDRRGGASLQIHFGELDRRVVNDYYVRDYDRHGHCPPGLAKKHNGCMPPGQAKKWQRGYPLPRDVTYYPLPHDLMVRLPPPPRDHRYVRVGGDVLMVSGGSSIVVDAMINFGR